MRLDRYSTFSDKQAFTAAGVVYGEYEIGSNNDRDVGPGSPVYLYATCTTAFAGNTDITLTLEHDSDAAFGSAEDVLSTGAIPVAELVSGKLLIVTTLPFNMKQYMRLRYDVSGTPTAGAIYAGLTMDAPAVRRNYPDRLSIW